VLDRVFEMPANNLTAVFRAGSLTSSASANAAE
jgi:hypothetical protein